MRKNTSACSMPDQAWLVTDQPTCLSVKRDCPASASKAASLDSIASKSAYAQDVMCAPEAQAACTEAFVAHMVFARARRYTAWQVNSTLLSWKATHFVLSEIAFSLFLKDKFVP